MWCRVYNMDRKELTRVWTNNGTERGHQSVKKELGVLHNGHNISASTVISRLLQYVLPARKKGHREIESLVGIVNQVVALINNIRAHLTIIRVQVIANVIHQLI